MHFTLLLPILYGIPRWITRSPRLVAKRYVVTCCKPKAVGRGRGETSFKEADDRWRLRLENSSFISSIDLLSAGTAVVVAQPCCCLLLWFGRLDKCGREFVWQQSSVNNNVRAWRGVDCSHHRSTERASCVWKITCGLMTLTERPSRVCAFDYEVQQRFVQRRVIVTWPRERAGFLSAGEVA